MTTQTRYRMSYFGLQFTLRFRGERNIHIATARARDILICAHHHQIGVREHITRCITDTLFSLHCISTSFHMILMYDIHLKIICYCLTFNFHILDFDAFFRCSLGCFSVVCSLLFQFSFLLCLQRFDHVDFLFAVCVVVVVIILLLYCCKRLLVDDIVLLPLLLRFFTLNFYHRPF